MFNIARKQWKWKFYNPVSDIKLPKVRNERVRYLSEKDLRMTKRYAHLNVDSLRNVVSKLNITFLSRSEEVTHAEIL